MKVLRLFLCFLLLASIPLSPSHTLVTNYYHEDYVEYLYSSDYNKQPCQNVGDIRTFWEYDFEENIEYEDELNPVVLDSIHLAGSRFDKLLKQIMES